MTTAQFILLIIVLSGVQVLFAADVACYFRANPETRRRFLRVPFGGILALFICGKGNSNNKIGSHRP